MRLVRSLMSKLAPLLRACQTAQYTLWNDNMIPIGRNWRQEINEQLEMSRAGLLLLSPNAIASGYIRDNELPTFLLQQKLILVGLKPIDIATHLPAALVELPIYRLPTAHGRLLYYSECTPAQRETFAFELYQQIQQRLS